MAEMITYNFHKLTEQQQVEMTRCVRGLGFDPDGVSVDFAAEHVHGRLKLYLTILLRNATGAVVLDGDEPAHRSDTFIVPDYLVPEFLRDPS